MSTATDSLSERYLVALGRRIPDKIRSDTLNRVRESLEADVAARVAAGASRESAERDALVAFGDPDRLAAGYAGRPLHLIGPALYLDWRRLLSLLLTVVLPIVAGALVFAQAIASVPPLDIVLSTVSTVISAGIGLVFWTTLVFAILERVGAGDAPLTTWDPDDLPKPSGKPDVGIGDLIGGVLAVVLLVGGVIWQATASPFVDEAGALITFFDPGLWPWWISYFIAVMVGELLFAIVLYRRRRWSPWLAAANIALNAAFTVPFVTLLARDEIVNPAFSQEFAGTGMVMLGQQGAIWLALGIAAIAVWDSIDGIIKTARAPR